ncbi:hypothetical protein Hanom_Chr05g00446531 [Helianthus anomalus]
MVACYLAWQLWLQPWRGLILFVLRQDNGRRSESCCGYGGGWNPQRPSSLWHHRTRWPSLSDMLLSP